FDQQKIIGGHVEWVRRADRKIRRIKNLRRAWWCHALRRCGVARPDPHYAVLLLHRDHTEPRLRRNGLVRLGRNRNALSARVVAQSVVCAFQTSTVKQFALREREALMAATVVECDDFTFVGTPHYDRPSDYLVSLQFTLGKLGRETNGIPAILDIFECAHDETVSSGHFLASALHCAG